MIAKLRGIADSFGEDSVIVDVNGVGYLVYVSGKTLSSLSKGGETTLFIETVVREDSISLYGFGTALEKEWFLTLTKVQGVGAKVCLNILTVLSPLQLAQALAAQDKNAFARAAGVGPKLAARIVTELKGKMVGLPIGADTADYVKAIEPEVKDDSTPIAPNLNDDAISALMNLGYQRTEAYMAVTSACGKYNGDKLSELIRLALKEITTKDF